MWRRSVLAAVGVVVAAGLAAPTASAGSDTVAADLVPVALSPELSGNARFGHAVAVSGDTLLIGAPDDDAPDNASGSATVYVAGEDGAWLEQARLVAADGTKYDNFGLAVAVDGDTAVVGAPYASPGEYSEGRAYVFVRSGSTWTQQAELVPSGIGVNTYAGWSVAVQGDLAVVSVHGGTSDHGGHVSLFVRSGATWTEQAVLEDPEVGGFGGFGSSVSIDADTLAVGQSPTVDGPGDEQDESAYVYVGSGADWSLQARLMAGDSRPDDGFGQSIDLSDNTIVVGADDDDVDGIRGRGSAYVFQRSGSTWTERAHLFAEEADSAGSFGQAVSVDGNTIAVSSYDYSVDGVAPGAGAVYVFRRSDQEWTQRRLLVAPEAEAGEHFGYDVALAKRPGGGRTLVSGAVFDGRSGTAYVYRW